MNSLKKIAIKSMAYEVPYVRQLELEDIVNETQLHMQKGFLGRGFAKLSTSGGEGTYKQLRTNSPFNIAQLGFPHA